MQGLTKRAWTKKPKPMSAALCCMKLKLRKGLEVAVLRQQHTEQMTPSNADFLARMGGWIGTRQHDTKMRIIFNMQIAGMLGKHTDAT